MLANKIRFPMIVALALTLVACGGRKKRAIEDIPPEKAADAESAYLADPHEVTVQVTFVNMEKKVEDPTGYRVTFTPLIPFVEEVCLGDVVTGIQEEGAEAGYILDGNCEYEVFVEGGPFENGGLTIVTFDNSKQQSNVVDPKLFVGVAFVGIVEPVTPGTVDHVDDPSEEADLTVEISLPDLQ